MAKKENDLISFSLRLPREVERLFDEMIHRPWGFCREILGWDPSVDLWETHETFILEADLPGVKPEDVTVEVEGDEVVLQGSRSLATNRSDGRFHTIERCSGQFVRRMKLPVLVEKDAIQVDFRDGVLRVILPKLNRSNEKP